MTTVADGIVLASHSWATETVTAEHHPHDQGMKFVVYVIGGKRHGAEIHCPSQRSALKLFDQIIAYRSRYSDHPFLADVSESR